MITEKMTPIFPIEWRQEQFFTEMVSDQILNSGFF